MFILTIIIPNCRCTAFINAFDDFLNGAGQILTKQGITDVPNFPNLVASALFVVLEGLISKKSKESQLINGWSTMSSRGYFRT